jgi:hypothetical protein
MAFMLQTQVEAVMVDMEGKAAVSRQTSHRNGGGTYINGFNVSDPSHNFTDDEWNQLGYDGNSHIVQACSHSTNNQGGGCGTQGRHLHEGRGHNSVHHDKPNIGAIEQIMHKEEIIKVKNKGRVEEAEVITVVEMDKILVLAVHTLEACNVICPVSAAFVICYIVVCCA